jgi:hypothetical protein
MHNEPMEKQQENPSVVVLQLLGSTGSYTTML